MLKIDNNCEGKFGKIYNWMVVVCSLLTSMFFILGIIKNDILFMYFGGLFVWIQILITRVYSSIRIFKNKDILLHNDVISEIQLKSRSISFEIMFNLFILTNIICNLILIVLRQEQSQIVVGIYLFSVFSSVMMIILKEIIMRKIRKNIH